MFIKLFSYLKDLTQPFRQYDLFLEFKYYMTVLVFNTYTNVNLVWNSYLS